MSQVETIIKVLKKEYPQSRTALEFENPLQIMVATILSAQCTDKRVNMVTPALFAKYPRVQDFAQAQTEELEEAIRSTGFYRNKARNIIAAAARIVSDFKGRVPDTMEDLLTLPGVARKTANIILCDGFGKAEGIAVDTHVKRLAGRMGLSREKDPNKIERDLMAVVPRSEWLDFNHILVDHGRAVCRARKPDCPRCVVRRFCPYPDQLEKEKAQQHP